MAGAGIGVDSGEFLCSGIGLLGLLDLNRLLLRLRLRGLAELPKNSLVEFVDDIGAKAEARGLTPEI